MQILITGSNGFIGKNLIAELENLRKGKLKGYSKIDEEAIEILSFDTNTDVSILDEYAKKCDFVYHLAGVNRTDDPSEFERGNFVFTETLLELLQKYHNQAPIMLASSIQAKRDNPYGKSKKAGEDLLFDYGRKNNIRTLVYRFPNIFGKWCRPNYNSAVATFCYNIARGVPIQVNDPKVMMQLAYIDDVVEELIFALTGDEHQEKAEQINVFKDDRINTAKINTVHIADGRKFCEVPVTHQIELGKIVELIQNFKKSRDTLDVPDMSEDFTKKMYATYLSYIPEDAFSYPLKMNLDSRGSFTEFIRTPDRGQVAVNISKPGITKGEHWHHTKNEKFLVVKGKGLIQFRKINSEQVIKYHVSDDQLEVVDIPTGYTHNIINEGEEDLITVMWANETFDPSNPDTFFEPVIKEKA